MNFFINSLRIFSLSLILLLSSAFNLKANNFIWEINSPEGTTVAYLLGSIHLARADMYPLNEVINNAYEKSSYLVVEADITDTSQAISLTPLILTVGYYTDGRTIKDTLDIETLSLLKQSGFDPFSFNNQKPWLIAASLQMKNLQNLDYSEEYGVDRHFIKRAKLQGKSLIELEGVTKQLKMFANLNDHEQDLFLRNVLYSYEDLPQTIAKIFEVWLVGDVAKMESILFEDFDKHPELLPIFQKMFIDRNINMLASILSLIKSSQDQIAFMIVGAGHLVGPENILDGLKANGFILKQL